MIEIADDKMIRNQIWAAIYTKRDLEMAEHLGVADQLYAQMMGWA